VENSTSNEGQDVLGVSLNRSARCISCSTPRVTDGAERWPTSRTCLHVPVSGTKGEKLATASDV